MKKTLIVLTVFAIVTCGCAMNGSAVEKSNSRQYLGITLPKGSEFTPIVVESSKERTVIARVAHVDNRRDIQVLEDRGHGWRPLGVNGLGITGVDGNFLMSAIIGKDGRIWVLARYTRPSNPDRGETHYLYVYDGSRWQIAGPKNGAPSGINADRGLGFLDDRVAHVYSDYDVKNMREKPYLRYLDGNRWKTAAAEKLLRHTPGRTFWTGSDLWHLVCSKTKDSTILDAYIVSGAGADGISGPHRLVEVAGNNRHLSAFAASPKGDLAVLLSQEGPTEWFPYMLRGTGRSRWTEPLPLPSLPVKYGIRGFVWSPAGELMLLHQPSFHTVVVHVLREGEWTKIAQGEQAGPGQIFSPRATFSADGQPIVTWEIFHSF